MIPSGGNEDKPELQKITAKVNELSFGHESRNGNAYAKLMADGKMFFVWNDSWREELKEAEPLYTMETTFEIYFRNKADDPGDTFLCLEAIVPKEPGKASMFLERHISDDFEGTTEEEKAEARELAEEIYGDFPA